MILFSFLIISCEKEEIAPEPVANFTASKTSAEVDETIMFTNSSENATTYFWDFGDGNTSIDENPIHSYSGNGTFMVTLTATGDGRENSTSKTITVAYPAPVANFTMDKTEAETDETITFTNSSENATTYSWDFGDGNTSIDENPTHSYSSDGTFTVTLTATGDGGENSTSKTITITAPPVVGTYIEIPRSTSTQLTRTPLVNFTPVTDVSISVTGDDSDYIEVNLDDWSTIWGSLNIDTKYTITVKNSAPERYLYVRIIITYSAGDVISLPLYEDFTINPN